MEKIFELGVQRYVAAIPATPLNVYDHIVLVANTLIDIVRFLVLSIPSVIESLIFLFVPRPKKDVTGQVVLVDISLLFIFNRKRGLQLTHFSCSDLDHRSW